MPAAHITWPVARPEDVGFAPGLAARIDAGRRAGLLRNLHAVAIARHGVLVGERYWPGPDEAWGRPLGNIGFGPDTLHDLRSITKSVVSLLYGIALARGQVPPPEAPLLAQFPEYPDLAADPSRAGITIGHALTMSPGLEWDETLPYTDPRNSEIAMEHAPDRLRFILERTVVAEPGKRWEYSGGAAALIGALIARGTGRTLYDFARETLFEPLGIQAFEWAAGQDGSVSAASGLRLTARDLLKIGTMVLAEGRWPLQAGSVGEQPGEIVPADWIAVSHRPHLPTGDGLDYGYLWFQLEMQVKALGRRRWIAGFGNGGQRLWLLPGTGIVCVVYCGAYNAPDAWITPTRIWAEIVLANLIKP